MDISKNIDIIIEKTDNGRLIWDYLDNEKRVCNALNIVSTSKSEEKFGYNNILNNSISQMLNGTRVFESDSSFIANVGKNYIVIIKYRIGGNNILTLDKLEIGFIPRTFKGVRFFNSNECDRLQELYTVVKKSIPSVDDIMNDLSNL